MRETFEMANNSFYWSQPITVYTSKCAKYKHLTNVHTLPCQEPSNNFSSFVIRHRSSPVDGNNSAYSRRNVPSKSRVPVHRRSRHLTQILILFGKTTERLWSEALPLSICRMRSHQQVASLAQITSCVRSRTTLAGSRVCAKRSRRF